MTRLILPLASLLALIPIVTAQSAEYGQCGGIGWTGATPSSTTTTSSYSSSSASATSSTALPTGTSDAGLSNVAKAAGKKYFGTATDNPELTDVPYVTQLNNTNDFTQITPTLSVIGIKDATEPEEGTWTFTDGDVIVDLAEGNGQLMRGTRISDIYTIFVGLKRIDQVTTASGTINFPTGSPLELGPTKHSLRSSPITVERSLVITLERYSWDIINGRTSFSHGIRSLTAISEPFNDDGTWRSDVFYDTMGEYFVPVALNAARAADPNAKLYINDYNIEAPGAKSTAMINLVQSLQAAGVPIDGVGIQGHLIVGEVPTTMQENMEAFTALGIEVAITELDIRMTLPETAALLEQQKADYQTVIEACNAVPGCVGVTLWDWTDKNLVKKPAYDGIVAGFT
ncbi:hypothetical protein H0H92_014232 [Tricholoma furcatifolium]|nr:hypothetical protein H0H92_014232 [Tricholoma furcatifolium]